MYVGKLLEFWGNGHAIVFKNATNYLVQKTPKNIDVQYLCASTGYALLYAKLYISEECEESE